MRRFITILSLALFCSAALYACRSWLREARAADASQARVQNLHWGRDDAWDGTVVSRRNSGGSLVFTDQHNSSVTLSALRRLQGITIGDGTTTRTGITSIRFPDQGISVDATSKGVVTISAGGGGSSNVWDITGGDARTSTAVTGSVRPRSDEAVNLGEWNLGWGTLWTGTVVTSGTGWFGNLRTTGTLTGAIADWPTTDALVIYQGDTFSGDVTATLQADGDTPLTVVDDSHNHVIGNIDDADWGDVTIAGGTMTLDADVVSTPEMADADHGDVSWSGGTATVDSGAVLLNEIGNPSGNASFTMSNRTLDFTFTNPAGGLDLYASGAFTGELLEIRQDTGNPGSETHLLHLHASDADVIPFHINQDQSHIVLGYAEDAVATLTLYSDKVETTSNTMEISTGGGGLTVDGTGVQPLNANLTDLSDGWLSRSTYETIDAGDGATTVGNLTHLLFVAGTNITLSMAEGPSSHAALTINSTASGGGASNMWTLSGANGISTTVVTGEWRIGSGADLVVYEDILRLDNLNTTGVYATGNVDVDGTIGATGTVTAAGGLTVSGAATMRASLTVHDNILAVDNVVTTNLHVGAVYSDSNGGTTGTWTVGAYTFPAADGNNGQVLKTNGAGAVTWQNETAGTDDDFTSTVWNELQLHADVASLEIDEGTTFSLGTGEQVYITGSDYEDEKLLEVLGSGAGTFYAEADGDGYFTGRLTLGGTLYAASAELTGNLSVDGTIGCTSTLTVGAYTLPATDGAADQVLITNGAGTVSWGAASGGATTDTKTLLPMQGGDLSDGPTLSWNSTGYSAYLLYDQSTDEDAYFQWQCPENWDSSTSVTVKITYTMASATASSTVVWGVSMMCVSDGDAADMDTASFDTLSTSSKAVPTAGYMDVVSFTPADDNLTAQDMVFIRVMREAADPSDTATGDAELRMVELEFGRS